MEDITADDVLRETPEEAAHMPSYYSGYRFDFFFRLIDMRRLVSDDTPAVIEELRKLGNVRYHGRPVSIYGGMTDLPLIVTRADEASWFDARADLHTGTLWAEHDAHLRGETQRMERELRENMLGDTIWIYLEAATRTFLASGEAIFRAHRDDPGFDFGVPAVEYAKAMESEVNATIFPAVRARASALSSAERLVNIDGVSHDLGARFPHQSLGAMSNLIQHSEPLRKLLRQVFPDAEFLLQELPAHLLSITAVRNAAAHGARGAGVDYGRAAAVREAVLGIGAEGLITRLARVRMRARP
jgi:hypothetical protein